jgi:hypothetical protein
LFRPPPAVAAGDVMVLDIASDFDVFEVFDKMLAEC